MSVHWLVTSAPLFLKRPCIRLRHGLRYSTGPNGCIFIHIPKAAGLSISTALFGRVGPGHLSMHDYEQAYTQCELSRFYKFTFVRNPWDRLASAFYFLKAGGITAQDARFASRNLAAFDSFESFVLEWLTEENVSRYWHFIPQTNYFCDGNGRSLVDFIGHYETLDADFTQVCDRLGVYRSLPHVNRTQQRGEDYRSLFTPAMRSVVAGVYARDICLLGYDFESRGIRERASGGGAHPSTRPSRLGSFSTASGRPDDAGSRR